ncbi:uncharacterized protein SCHCODRAFT_02733361 [Schizophyllum commune H4-8]|nr:uncharacterized protein SCHCODRAFT_02733361 [Schizophyllum commune H4-8]KAI5892559.1 hypothetical protein SCHCODRAFT_02733361 [Schizophyllum commune H4-8]
MSFYLFFPPGGDLPPIAVYHFEHNDTWIAIRGDYNALLKSPRYERFQIPSLRQDRLGPQWILLPFIWRPYAVTTIISDRDPAAPVLWKPDVKDLLFENGTCRVKPEIAERMLKCARTFAEIGERLRTNTPLPFFLKDGTRIRPSNFDFQRILEDGRPGQILDHAHDFCIAALDHIAFVGWYTLSFKGYEDALSPPQLEVVRLCEFEKRPKRGCLLNLLVDYTLASFELWIQHRVPIYYLFTEAMSYVDRFVRVRPDVILDYRERAAAGALSEELIAHYRANEPAVLKYDDFFQIRRPLTQPDLFDTPIPIYDPKTHYSIQVCQGYRPYVIRNPPLIKLLLPRYEAVAHNTQFPRVDIARWAPRAINGEPQESDVFLMDRGFSDPTTTDDLLDDHAFDVNSGWINNNYLHLRELFKPAFAPGLGESYALDGSRLLFPAQADDWLREYERELVARAVHDGKPRPREYQDYHDWEVGWGGEIDGLTERTTKEGSSSVTEEGRDTEMGNASDSEEDRDEEYSTAPASTRPPLDQRITDPVTGESAATWTRPLSERISPPDPSARRRGRRDRWEEESEDGSSTPPSSVASSNRVWLNARRSASPTRSSRLADPGRVSSKLYSPDSKRWEALLEAFNRQLEELGQVMTAPRGTYVRDDVRRPRLDWDRDFVERGLLQVHSWQDRVCLVLYALFHHSLRTPIHFLDFVLEKGMKVTYLIPRDPIPSMARIGPQGAPSATVFPPLSGSNPTEIFQLWEALLDGPIWAKTHFPAFLQEGGTVSYVVRHYARRYLDVAGAGVSAETRVYARNSQPLPAKKFGNGFFVVSDRAGETELAVIGGRVANQRDALNPYYVVPPTATFDSKGWDIGNGEWSAAEEEYLNEVIQRWRTGRETILRTQTQWNRHASDWAYHYKQRRPHEARQTAPPSEGECEQWCAKLEEAYGISLEFRRISDLGKPLAIKNLRQFR